MFEKILHLFGITNDIITNTAPTESELKDKKDVNKTQRNYKFEVDKGFNQKDFDEIKKQAKEKAQKNISCDKVTEEPDDRDL